MNRSPSRSETPGLPALVSGETARAGARADGAALVNAQGEARRGLKGGVGVLSSAKSAYLATQWSGEHDRRPETGLLVRAKL